MDIGRIARRFPLIARPRPACLPLVQRVQSLVALADTATERGDPSMASTVYNQAALIASDVGVPDLAREMCHQHAAAYLHAAPLPSTAAIRALEPVVNLARLQLRAGQHDEARQHLLSLFEAVTTGAAARVEDIAIPARLTVSPMDRHEVRAWLWRVLLADGTRSLTAAGRWTDALAHLQAHRGVGQRMFDGRQVAVLNALMTGNTLDASRLLTTTHPGEPWENAVTGCLTVLYRQAAGRAWRRSLQNLVTTYLDRPDEEDLTVFNTRLGLAVLDVIPSPQDPAARLVAAELHRRAHTATDGYAARDALTHPSFTALATDRETQDCRDLLRDCALDAGALPDELRGQLAEALRTCDRTIRKSVSQRERAPRTDGTGASFVTGSSGTGDSANRD
ncbi:hypothetical protein [Streptomyces flavofungini]|uniref:hypothetical protein n=1 Tax=Streptomyces flavofungini TaxID=68200 RepID=UPI0019C01104|nr:hypothetical protein [Streptomyces flavofungini]GHC77033.1 hypothetical protein GCM10010349_57360 [Streptomyces flavofungini]